MLVEGDIVILLAGFLVHRGVLAFWPSLLVIVFGALLGDFLWYYFGSRLAGSPSRWVRLVERTLGFFDKYLVAHPAKAVLFTKFTYGLHRAVLLRVGMIKYPFSRFWRVDVPATLLWVSVLGSAGYLASYSFGYVKHLVKFVELGLALTVLVVIVLERTISFFLRRRAAPGEVSD